MFKVILSDEAEIALDKFADQDKQDVDKWLEQLKSWRPDKFISRMGGLILGNGEKLYILKTDNEIRLVFKKDARRITVTQIFPTEAVRRRVLDKARKTRRARIAQAS